MAVLLNYIQADRITVKIAQGMRDVTERELHTFHEILLIINGNLELISEHSHPTGGAGTLFIIPKQRFHQFILHSDVSDYTRCVIAFEDIPSLQPLIDRKMTIPFAVTAAPELLRLFQKLEHCDTVTNKDERDILCQALLAEILIELTPPDIQQDTPLFSSPITDDAIRYVDEHLTETIRIPDIANFLHLSVSHLNHTFKEDLHVSLYRYILEKKLILANSKISSGVPASKAASECGFIDYSGFYRLYRKMYGTAPSRWVARGTI